MTLSIQPIRPDFIAEVRGLDMREPPSPELMREIEQANDRYAVLVFRDQPLTDEQHVGFTRPFGRLETTIKAYRPGSNHASPRRSRTSPTWMRTAKSCPPATAAAGKNSFLRAIAVSGEGGETKFADMRAAYDALPDRMKTRLEGLSAEHSLLYSRGLIGFTDFSDEEKTRLGSSPQRIVRTHPGSGRKTLYLAAHAMMIHGMAIPEGRILLRDLMEHATQPGFVHTHTWAAGDMVMWDNRCTMHRACEYDPAEIRELRRTTVMKHASTLAQAA